MILKNDNLHDFRMIYFNSDGYEGTMCGNGGRCITAFAASLGLISNEAVFLASDGVHRSIILKNTINLKMSNVSEIKKFDDGFFVNSGSPHFICLNKNPNKININFIGKKIRYQQRFAPEGVNVDFITKKENIITIATFERGVEAETLSCGTGSVASAIAVSINKPDGKYNYIINAKGGKLQVSFQKKRNMFSNIWLSGTAVKVFEGTFETETLIL